MGSRQIRKIKRGKPKRPPKARFVLFCEGKNTEPAYFKAIKKVWVGALIDIESRGGVGVPMTIAQRALDFAREHGLLKSSRRRTNSFEENDRVWAVFDRDDHGKYNDAVNLCESNGIGVARSNPCFELWLILHETEYEKSDGRDKVQKKLESLRSEYDRKSGKMPDCEEMVTRVLQAEARGAKQLQRRVDQGAPFEAPSTTVGNLTREIREADERVRQGN